MINRLLMVFAIGLGILLTVVGIVAQTPDANGVTRTCILPLQPTCEPVYQDPAWSISVCPDDPNVPYTMTIWVDGAVQPIPAARLEIAHLTEDGDSKPTVAVIYASGYVRLKQNADTPTIPFGSAFVLGPAYWSDVGTYHHHPQLTHLEIDTATLQTGPLRMRIWGTTVAFEVLYELTMPPPRDQQTRLHVNQTYTATTGIVIDSGRFANKEGLKLMQVSSMYVGESTICDGGYTDCHDSNAARYIGSDLIRHQTMFTDLTSSSFVFSPTAPLGNTWFDTLHTDDESWQGNTPNVRIVLDALPDDHTITPQGWISTTNNPNDDNVGLWLHDDNPASQTWTAGQSGQVHYWLLAQDNPPKPWHDNALRSGMTFLDFEGDVDCYFVHDVGKNVTGTLSTIPGYTDTALQLHYDIGNDNGNWAQIRCDFNPPVDLSAYDHLRFDWRGDPAAANSLEVGLISQATSSQHIFGRGYHHVTHRGWWGQLVVPFTFLPPWTPETTLNSSQVTAFIISVVKDGDEDAGGAGTIAIDNLNAYNVVSRTVPSAFFTTVTNTEAATRAVAWLQHQQKPSGLLASWEEEDPCVAHIYDQALALIIFSHEGLWMQADALVEALGQTQNPDGSWCKCYSCDGETFQLADCQLWEGDVAWAVYALRRYLAFGGTHPQARDALLKGAGWLATRLDSEGCLALDHTEGSLDVWWAFQAAGFDYADEAEALQACLLTHYWDAAMGRFKGGRTWQQPYLDNQTWGAAFLKATGRAEDGRRVLSYAYEVLRLPAQGGQFLGFDGQAGPWGIWNEGTGQYIAVGGSEASRFIQELLVQQRSDGAMFGGPDAFSGGGVWITPWYGVAPTAWLYFALTPNEPYRRYFAVYLPLTLKDS